MTAVSLSGQFSLISSDNYEAYLSELGVSMMVRKLAGMSKPVVTISKDGDNYTISSKDEVKTHEMVFQLGREFERSRIDGKVSRTTIDATYGGLGFLEKDNTGDKTSQVKWEAEENGMKVTYSTGGVTAVRVFQRV